MSRRGPHLLLGALAAALFACQAGARERPKRLTLYCSTQIEWCEKVVTAFEAQSGIRAAMTRKSSGEVLAQLIAERRNPKGDVWFGGTGDAHLQAAELALTEPYRSPRLDQLHPWAIDPAGRGEHRTTGIYMGALGFGFNQEWLDARGLPAPKKWSDLLDPAYAGEIQLGNPSSSGTAYTALATFVQLFGEDEAFRFLKKLDRNVNQYTLSGAAPIRAAARGETGVGIVFLHDAMTEKLAGFPITLVGPEDGTGYEIGCVSVVRGARHLASAQAFVDFVLSPEGQALGAEAKAYQIPSNKRAPVHPQAPTVDQLRLIPFDQPRFGSKAERARLLKRFEAEVRGGAGG